MTRRKFKKLALALSIRIAEKHGHHVTGKMLRAQRDNSPAKILRDFGSYKAAWDWMKPVRDTYGMD